MELVVTKKTTPSNVWLIDGNLIIVDLKLKILLTSVVTFNDNNKKHTSISCDYQALFSKQVLNHYHEYTNHQLIHCIHA